MDRNMKIPCNMSSKFNHIGSTEYFLLTCYTRTHWLFWLTSYDKENMKLSHLYLMKFWRRHKWFMVSRWHTKLERPTVAISKCDVNFTVFNICEKTVKFRGVQQWMHQVWSQLTKQFVWKHTEMQSVTGKWTDNERVSTQMDLTLKWLGHCFSKWDFTFWCCSPYVQYFYMKLFLYSECLVSIVDTDGLVL